MAISLIAFGAGTYNTSTSVASSGSFDSTGANLIIASVTSYAGNAPAPTISDNFGNTYTALAQIPASGASGAYSVEQLFYCIGGTVGAGHVLSLSAQSYTGLVAGCFSGVGSLETFTQTAGDSAAMQPGSITPTQNGELLVVGSSSEGGSTPTTIDSGFTVGAFKAGGAGQFAASISYLIQTTATAKNPTVTENSGTRRGVTMAAFRAALSPVITGPSGAAGASNITVSAAENQNTVGTWTATNSASWSLSGTDAAALSISSSGVVTKASGNFDYETKASYSFNVNNGSATQAVTFNVTNQNEPPNAPTIGVATAGASAAMVTFTPGAVSGGPSTTGYTATSSPGGITGSGPSSPLTVSGLANGTAYTFTVTATNSEGTSSPSAASNSVTPVAAASGRAGATSSLSSLFTPLRIGAR